MKIIVALTVSYFLALTMSCFSQKRNASFKVPMFCMLSDITKRSVVICLTKKIKISHYFYDNLIPLVKGKIKSGLLIFLSVFPCHNSQQSKNAKPNNYILLNFNIQNKNKNEKKKQVMLKYFTTFILSCKAIKVTWLRKKAEIQ